MAIRLRLSGPGRPYEGLVRSTPGGPRWTGKVRLVPELLDWPIRRRKPLRIFVASMSDPFHESLTNEEIAAIFGVMAATPQHTHLLLTKRAARMREWFEWIHRSTDTPTPRIMYESEMCFIEAEHRGVVFAQSVIAPLWPLHNLWLGVSCEDQATFDERVPDLMACPAAVRWCSLEPLLGPINLIDTCGREMLRKLGVETLAGIRAIGGGTGLDWIVPGAESGPGARPCDLAWIRDIVKQGKETKTAVWVKQLGARPYERKPDMGLGPPGPDWCRVHDDGAAYYRYHRLCDRKGEDPSEWSEDLRVRELPT